MLKNHPDWANGYWDMVLAAQADLVIGLTDLADWNLKDIDPKDIDPVDCSGDGMSPLVLGNPIAFKQG